MKSILIGYVLVVLTNMILHPIFFETLPLYWWLLIDDPFATIVASLLFSPLGFFLYFEWMRHRQG
jgi:hypothetical protein